MRAHTAEGQRAKKMDAQYSRQAETLGRILNTQSCY